MEAKRGAPGRAFCPECAQKYAVPVEELRRRPGLRFRATCRSCKTTFSVRWETGELRTEVERVLDQAGVLDGRAVLRPGARIDKKYEIEAGISSGGSSTIYRAFDWGANRHVALKVLHRAPDDEGYGLRFQREVEVQGNLKHPNLMPIFDHGTWEGRPYYTMELLHKPMSLDAVVGLYRTNRLRYHPSLRHLAGLGSLLRSLVLPVGRAIAFANQNGVIHRDLKPGNILLDAKTLHVYIIDFGICHLFKKTGSRLVLRAGMDQKDEAQRMAMGTVRLMPPEQARGGVSETGDIWALGCLVYFILNGDAPIAPAIDLGRVSMEKRIDNLQMIAASCRSAGDADEAAFYEAKLEELRSGSHRTVRQMVRDAQQGSYLPLDDRVDPSLAAVVQRAMQPDPKDRYQTTQEFVEDLERWIDGKPVRAHAAALGPVRGALYRGRLFAHRNRTVLLATAAALLLAVISVVIWQVTTASKRARRIDLLLSEASASVDPAVQEDRLRTVLALDPSNSDARARLEIVRRFVPLKARVDEAAGVRRQIERQRRDGRAVALSRQAEDLASILERSVIPALHALPMSYPSRKLAVEAGEHALFLRGRRIVSLSNLPTDTEVFLVSARRRGTLALDWDNAKSWGVTPLPVSDRAVESGSYVLLLRSPKHDHRELCIPFMIDLNSGSRVALRIPIDPRTVPNDMVYARGGTHLEFGDLRFFEEVRTASVEPFFIDAREVTNQQYAKFLATLPDDQQDASVPRRVVDALSGNTNPLWDRGDDGAWTYPTGTARHPVTSITLDDARRYAAWAKKRLPTPEEWEHAARGVDGRDFPFGESLDRKACNAQTGTVAAVATHERDRSPFGVYDLGGNVAEWTDGSTGEYATVKGGSFDLPRYRAMPASVGRRKAGLPHPDVGFRCARDAK